MSPLTSLFSLLVGTLALSLVHGYNLGAPVEACVDMKPGHYGVNYRSADIGSPFAINASQYVYGVDAGPANITVTVFSKPNSSDPFKGFMLQARNLSDVNIGTFSLHPDSTLQLLACQGRNGTAVTHTRNISTDGVQKVEAVWTGPDVPSGNVTFVATVVQQFALVYMDVVSEMVIYSESGAPLPSFSCLCLLACFLLSAVL